jgi:hypothetical protein
LIYSRGWPEVLAVAARNRTAGNVGMLLAGIVVRVLVGIVVIIVEGTFEDLL